MHVLKRLLIFIAVLIGSIFLLTQYLRRNGMFFPSRYPEGDWVTTRLVPLPEERTFVTADGARLDGWLFRASEKHAPMVIWCHGNAGNLTDRIEMAEGLARRGVSTFLFDWRGFGKSSGVPSEDALYRDAMAAYDFAVRSLGASPEDIVMYGESIGGPYAAWVARQHRVRCVVIENSFPSLAAVGNSIYHPLPLGWFAPFAMTTRKWLNDAHVPVLVMHGRRDQVIPFRVGMELYEGLRVTKRLFVSANAGHGEIPMVEGARYYDAVTAFVKAPPH